MLVTRVAIYLRVSTAQQAHEDRTSIPEQRRLLEAIAERQGWTADVYEEVGSAGDGAAGLPVLTEVLGRITMGGYSKLLVYHLDRLSRAGVGEGERIKAILASAGCEIVTPGGRYDPRNESDDLSTDVQWLIAKQEHRRIFHRTYQGLEAVAKAGDRVLGHAIPFGYRAVYAPDGTRHIEVNPLQAATIRRAYELLFSGVGRQRAIANRLNAEGHLGPKGDPISQYLVEYWLKNPRYAGMETRRSPHTKWYRGKRKFATLTEPMIVPSKAWPAIVSFEEWEQAQEWLKRKAGTRPARSPLGGILHCYKCGGKPVACIGERAQNYQCRTPGCDVGLITMQPAHDAVYRWLMKLLEEGLPEPPRPEAAKGAEAAEIQRLLDENQRKSDKLLDLLLAGTIDDDQAARKSTELKAEREALIKRKGATPKQPPPMSLPPITTEDLARIEPTYTDPLFGELIRSLLVSVTLEPGRLYSYRDRLNRPRKGKSYRVKSGQFLNGAYFL